jgi:hypothetical protein
MYFVPGEDISLLANILLYLNPVVFIYVWTWSIQITENVYDHDSAVKQQAFFDLYDDDSAVKHQAFFDLYDDDITVNNKHSLTLSTMKLQ